MYYKLKIKMLKDNLVIVFSYKRIQSKSFNWSYL